MKRQTNKTHPGEEKNVAPKTKYLVFGAFLLYDWYNLNFNMLSYDNKKMLSKLKNVSMSDFISLAEAASRTGKSEMTIRRLTKKDSAKKHVSHRNGIILIRAEFVNGIYPLLDNHVNIDNKNVNYVNKNVNTHQVESKNPNSSEIAVLEAKLEGQAALLESKQNYIILLEKQFQEYKDEKQKEVDRLHERWSQEQEIFKRDQHLNAGKYMIQKNQDLSESIDNEEKKSLWKRIFG